MSGDARDTTLSAAMLEAAARVLYEQRRASWDKIEWHQLPELVPKGESVKQASRRRARAIVEAALNARS